MRIISGDILLGFGGMLGTVILSKCPISHVGTIGQ